MQVLEQASGKREARPSPEWVADWWMPPSDPGAVDLDLAALLAPEPVALVAVEVSGRLADREAIAG
jgi:hypothetical protein